jgi:hypothetical protein
MEPSMPKTLLVVRAEVPDPRDRPKFEEWYRTDHLPLALKTFGAVRGWRCWSRTDPATHFAFYEFAGPAEAEAVTAPDRIAPLVADFDRVWGKRVVRRREILEVAQEITA